MNTNRKGRDPRRGHKRNNGGTGRIVVRECATRDCFNPVRTPEDIRRVTCGECVQRLLARADRGAA
jgi:hypothetical protein